MHIQCVAFFHHHVPFVQRRVVVVVSQHLKTVMPCWFRLQQGTAPPDDHPPMTVLAVKRLMPLLSHAPTVRGQAGCHAAALLLTSRQCLVMRGPCWSRRCWGGTRAGAPPPLEDDHHRVTLLH